MGVYIKGMEMPSKCVECRLATKTDFDSCPFCDVTMRDLSKDEWWYERPQDCPLVPVPPHGRLGDLDAIRADIDEKRPGRSYEDAWALTVIDTAPTIIPAEEGE